MSVLRKVEVFTAGCPICEEAVALVRSIACSSCDVQVLDMKKADVAEKARRYGVRSVPAIAVDEALAACCEGPQIDERALRASGIGVPLSS